jgi:hypothetical protein
MYARRVDVDDDAVSYGELVLTVLTDFETIMKIIWKIY